MSCSKFWMVESPALESSSQNPQSWRSLHRCRTPQYHSPQSCQSLRKSSSLSIAFKFQFSNHVTWCINKGQLYCFESKSRGRQEHGCGECHVREGQPHPCRLEHAQEGVYHWDTERQSSTGSEERRGTEAQLFSHLFCTDLIAVESYNSLHCPGSGYPRLSMAFQLAWFIWHFIFKIQGVIQIAIAAATFNPQQLMAANPLTLTNSSNWAVRTWTSRSYACPHGQWCTPPVLRRQQPWRPDSRLFFLFNYLLTGLTEKSAAVIDPASAWLIQKKNWLLPALLVLGPTLESSTSN